MAVKFPAWEVECSGLEGAKGWRRWGATAALLWRRRPRRSRFAFGGEHPRELFAVGHAAPPSVARLGRTPVKFGKREFGKEKVKK